MPAAKRSDEQRPCDGEAHRVQLRHPGESPQAGPALRVAIDDLLDGGQVLLERVRGEGAHQEPLAAPLLFAVQEWDGLRIEELLDVRRVRPSARHVLVVEDQRERLGTDEARGGSTEDVDAEDRAELAGALLQEARGVAHEREGVADQRQGEARRQLAQRWAGTCVAHRNVPRARCTATARECPAAGTGVDAHPRR